jgi:hypothetical protein
LNGSIDLSGKEAEKPLGKIFAKDGFLEFSLAMLRRDKLPAHAVLKLQRRS